MNVRERAEKWLNDYPFVEIRPVSIIRDLLAELITMCVECMEGKARQALADAGMEEEP